MKFFHQGLTTIVLLICFLIGCGCGFTSHNSEVQFSSPRKSELKIMINDSTEDSLSVFFFTNPSEDTLVVEISSKKSFDRRRIILNDFDLPNCIVLRFFIPFVDDIKIYEIWKDSSLTEIKDIEIQSYDSLGNSIFHAGFDPGSYYQVILEDLTGDVFELSVTWIVYLY